MRKRGMSMVVWHIRLHPCGVISTCRFVMSHILSVLFSHVTGSADCIFSGGAGCYQLRTASIPCHTPFSDCIAFMISTRLLQLTLGHAAPSTCAHASCVLRAGAVSCQGVRDPAPHQRGGLRRARLQHQVRGGVGAGLRQLNP